MASVPQEGRGELKEAVSVSEMARLVGLSRARLYQLVEQGVFLSPVYDLRSRRPFYPRQIQAENLAIRKNNVGANGQVILFYSRRSTATRSSTTGSAAKTRALRQKKKQAGGHDDVVTALRHLGLSVSPAEVAGAVGVLYPDGPDGIETGEVIRAIFRHLRQSERRDRADNVGR